MKYDNLIKTINQLKKTNKILHSNNAIKDETIKKLQEKIETRSNEELSMVFFVPKSDEIDLGLI